ncbi:hypothetical protein MHUMG1_09853 [Metarhizium humberi]|uniref:Uncharacterized protein n=1 Tax=Metarhizium humberi TaxID=2596975 RepID=A0A9P8M1F8_9HYPO|nr:hypothetical protein MHUMG1_09853 [Metarhizium humberi]
MRNSGDAQPSCPGRRERPHARDTRGRYVVNGVRLKRAVLPTYGGKVIVRDDDALVSGCVVGSRFPLQDRIVWNLLVHYIETQLPCQIIHQGGDVNYGLVQGLVDIHQRGTVPSSNTRSMSVYLAHCLAVGLVGSWNDPVWRSLEDGDALGDVDDFW